MTDPIAWFARHRVAANLLMVGIVVCGLLTLPRITREVFPDITPDLVTVRVVHPGAAPDDVEEAIVERIEEELDGVAGIRRITSTAAEGSANDAPASRTRPAHRTRPTACRRLTRRPQPLSRRHSATTSPEPSQNPLLADLAQRSPRMASALSVRSQGRPMFSRPKWP